jgi:hypothetical protein
MAEHGGPAGRDPVDDWLNAEVEPLSPPPGTFERVSRRAHRRKVIRASLSAAGVAVVIAVAAATPGIVSALHSGTGRPVPPVAANSPRPTAAPAVTGQGTGGVSAQSSSPVAGTPAPASLVHQGPLPQNFQPTSVTFIGQHTGAVIGQAGTQGHCASKYCTSLAGTTDYGGSWFGVSAPRTGAPAGGQGVGQLRFLDTDNGWAFGPQLWVTRDAGATWRQQPTGGMRVTDLETSGSRAFALFARCAGTGPAFGADCASVSLYTSSVSGSGWQPVTGPTSGLTAATAGQPAAASLVLTASRGYLLAPSGELFSGPLTGAAWTSVDARAPCAAGAPGPGGQPTGALLAAGPAQAGGQAQLVIVCASSAGQGGDSQVKQVWQSANGGASWNQTGTAPQTGTATSVATQGSLVVLATDAGVYQSTNGGTSWRLARASPAGAAAGQQGFSYVGMTSSSQGVALPADPGLHEVFITTDGGTSWQASSL